MPRYLPIFNSSLLQILRWESLASAPAYSQPPPKKLNSPGRAQEPFLDRQGPLRVTLMPMFLPFCPRQKSQPTKWKSTINHYRSIYKRGCKGIEIVGQHKVVDYHLLPCLSFEFLHGDPKYIWRLPAPDGGSPNSGRRAKNEGGQAQSQQGSRNFGHATNVQPGTWPTVIKSAHSGLKCLLIFANCYKSTVELLHW